LQSKIAQCGLVLGVPATAEASQQWVLTAMQTHGPAILTMLWRILGNEQDVCDVYQESFLQLAYCEQGLKPRNVKSYVFRTATNIAISMLRRRQVEKRFNNEKMQVCAASQPDAGTELDAASLQEKLRQQMAMLPENLREVLVLHDLAELSYEQAAAILGLTPATARVYRCKAVQLLSEWMGDKYEDE
jgi:RNA polymerase sigma factor (sigma-70 family)